MLIASQPENRGYACNNQRGSSLEIDVRYDEAAQRLQVVTNRDLGDGESLYMQVRRGQVDGIDCRRDADTLMRIDGNGVSGAEQPTFEGVEASPSDFELTYTTDWVRGEPTQDLLAEIEQGQRFIDVCVLKDGEVVEHKAFHIRRALDQAGSNGKSDR